MLGQDLAKELLPLILQPGEFRLKYHEKYPNAPLSPFKVVFDTPPLTERHIERLGGLLQDLDFRLGNLPFQAVVGVPQGAQALARDFARSSHPLLWLDKMTWRGKKRIYTGDQFYRSLGELTLKPPKDEVAVLVIEDTVTEANNTVEAIVALRSCRSPRLRVRHVLAVVDREQGGRERLARIGVDLHAVWKVFSDLLPLGEQEGIRPIDYEAARIYLGAWWRMPKIARAVASKGRT